MNTLTSVAAATYNCNAYGAGTYSNSQCVTGTGTNPQTGALPGTGMDFWVPLVIGVVLIVTGTVFFVRRVVKRASAKN